MLRPFILVVPAALLAVPGCEAIKTASREVGEREQLVREASDSFVRRSTPHVSVHDRPLLGTEVRPYTGGTPLPARLELNPGGFRYSGSRDQPLDVALSSIRNASGVPIVLERGDGADVGQERGDLPAWSGPLSAFLDVLATEHDVVWQYDGKAVRIRPFLTKTFVLPTPIADATFASSSAAAGSEENTGRQEVSADFKDVDPWDDVDALLEAAMPAGAGYVRAVSTGEVTITARPSDLARLEDIIDGLYERHGTQVLLRVTWMVVDISDADDYQLDLQAVFRDAASGLRIGFNSPVSSLVDVAGAGGVAVVNPPADSDLQNWDTSRLLYTALSRSGRLVDHRTFAQAVKNNTPAAFNDRTLRDYLKNFSRQRGTDGQGDTFSTEVDTLSLGSTLQILPRVLSGERLGLLLTMSQASLVELQTLPLGDDGSFIQLAERANREIPANEVILQNGQSLVLAGFEGDTVTRNQVGTGTPGFFGLGGVQQGEVKRTRLILVVTPTIRKLPPRRRPPAVVLTQRAAS